MQSGSLFSNEFLDYIIQKLLYGSDTRKIKIYFHVVYGGGRRIYGGAGRNSLMRIENYIGFSYSVSLLS